MKKIDLILRKCKTLSRQLSRTSSYSSLRSKSSRNHQELYWDHHATTSDHLHHHHDQYAIMQDDKEPRETIFVGSTKRRYVISSKHLNHPLLNALIEKSKQKSGDDILVKCEVVLFDHLLWMLENADPNLSPDSLEELTELYVF